MDPKTCRCCLQYPSDMDMTIPYTHFGKTEIYADMLQDCFDIKLKLGESGSCGICQSCVGHLRDASNFKLQVQRSQAELQGTLLEDEGEHTVKLKMSIQDVGEGSYEVPWIKSETLDDDKTVEGAAPVKFGMRGESALLKKAHNTFDICVKIEQKSYILAGDSRLTDTRKTSPKKVSLKDEHATKMCNDKSTVKTTLISGTHVDQTRFLCEFCNKMFKKSSNLHRHIKVHTGVKAYSCDECNRQFSEKSVLINHTRRHTKEKPFTCEECGKAFAHRSGLYNHIRTHTGEKPYGCEYCDKRFTQKSNLDLHRRIHNGEKPFTCEECNKQFTLKGTLIRHKRTHTGEKPFECGECIQRFATQHCLKTHIRMHTGERPYNCEVCHKKFAQSSDLSRHKRIHMRDKTTKLIN